jgi:PLP dependent protein
MHINPSLGPQTLKERFHQVENELQRACLKAQRAREEVSLMAVSKFQSHEMILPLLAEGQRLFGENRVQEGGEKWPQLKTLYKDISLHLIGPLQSNKLLLALAHFDAIQSLDRPKLAALLAEKRQEGKKLPKLYIQVNIGHEPQKSGIMPEEFEAFLRLCQDVYELEIAGLMAIPPQGQPAKSYFEDMASLKARYKLKELSIGMSADIDCAIACGSTMVRVGTALFGARSP